MPRNLPVEEEGREGGAERGGGGKGGRGGEVREGGREGQRGEEIDVLIMSIVAHSVLKKM